MSEWIYGLGRAIDELAAIDPSTLTDDELHDLVIELVREESRFAAAQGGAWSRRGTHAGSGPTTAPKLRPPA